MNRYSSAETTIRPKTQTELSLREAVGIHKKAFGLKHEMTAQSLRNLANYLSRFEPDQDSQKRFEEAEKLYRQEFKIYKKKFGVEDPHTIFSLNYLTHFLTKTMVVEKISALCKITDSIGEISAMKQFVALLQRTEKFCREALRDIDYPAKRRNVIPLRELRDGLRIDLKIARRDGKEMQKKHAGMIAKMKIRKKALGVEHPGLVAKELDILAKQFKHDGKMEESEYISQKAVAIRHKEFYSYYPDTVKILCGVACFLEGKGNSEEAEKLYREALDIQKRIPLSPKNININEMTQCFYSLANFLINKGKYAEAEPLYRSALETQEKMLPSDHPDTLQGIFILAQLLRDKSEHAESALLYRRIIAIGEKLCKRDDNINSSLLGIMAASHNNIAFHTDVPAKNWKEAEAHYRASIALFKRVEHFSGEVTNVKLNLQILFHLSGRKTNVDEVRSLTKILDQAKDKRAEKGHKILQELEGAK